MSLDLEQRVVALPISVRHASMRRQAITAAVLVAKGDVRAADEIARALAERAAGEVILREQVLRAAALARLFIDLATAGWELTVEDGQVFGLPPRLEVVRSDAALTRSKAITRATMLARVREQVAGERRLVEEVEPGIARLIADGEALADALQRRGADAVQPYLQLARRADGNDEHTGLPLHSVFRYLRYWWAFPYNDTPGRSLPFLIRDRGQPNHPVCGLLCLSSPLLRLTDRDDALGLTPAWLEAAVAMLGAVSAPDALGALASLREELRRQGRAALSAARMEHDAGNLLRLDAPLSRWVARASMEERVDRAESAAGRVAGELANDLRIAIEGVSFAGLGVTLDEALAAPGPASERLRQIGKDAHEAWAEARKGEISRGSHADLKRLFLKKRARQLADLLVGWGALAPVREALTRGEALAGLRAATLGSRLSLGGSVQRGLTEALLARKVRLASTQIADVSLCGAIPPYNGLLGGKLAAMIALSREASYEYHRVYDGKVSDIQSKMAGEDVVRPAELVALTTTSFYGVGSSQYNRVSMPGPGGHRWEEVGTTRGHGTLHLSAELCRLLSELLIAAEGKQLITSTFGEGPSERLRKLRDGMGVLDLPASSLLQHGFSRLVYVAPLGARTMPGAVPAPARHHLDGPTEGEVAEAWRARWLTPRLGRAIDHARAFDASSVLLSSRFPSELTGGRDGRPLLIYDAAPEDEVAWGRHEL